MKCFLVLAQDLDGGIGKKGSLPWHFPQELSYFSQLTRQTKNPEKQNRIIMGRKTWQAIPKAPLPERQNVILTRDRAFSAVNALVMHNFKDALEQSLDNIETIYCIGGGQIFDQALKDQVVQGIYLTQIHARYDCDVFFPPVIWGQKHLIQTLHQNGVQLDFWFYSKERN